MMRAIDFRTKLLPKLVTATVVAVAAICAYALYVRNRQMPWTRDGQVRANVVQIAPRVNGYLIEVAVQDNQSVRKGDLLFRIDPSSYQLAVDNARLRPGDPLPSIRQLANDLNLNNKTVAKAYRLLERDAKWLG